MDSAEENVCKKGSYIIAPWDRKRTIQQCRTLRKTVQCHLTHSTNACRVLREALWSSATEIAAGLPIPAVLAVSLLAG